ncbi:hypothetical protein PTR77_18480 [Serratia bockelmannii]|uniref:hypothetical protein n=1 Tax=Serratia bockelmannii TaxID=2703793 RepID=UPI00313B5AE8
MTFNNELLEKNNHARVAEIDIDNGQHCASDIIPSVAIDRIIAQRNEGITLYMEALTTLSRARELLSLSTARDYLSGFDTCVYDAVRWSDKPERVIAAIKKLVDAKIWDRLLSETVNATIFDRFSPFLMSAIHQPG